MLSRKARYMASRAYSCATTFGVGDLVETPADIGIISKLFQDHGETVAEVELLRGHHATERFSVDELTLKKRAKDVAKETKDSDLKEALKKFGSTRWYVHGDQSEFLSTVKSGGFRVGIVRKSEEGKGNYIVYEMTGDARKLRRLAQKLLRLRGVKWDNTYSGPHSSKSLLDELPDEFKASLTVGLSRKARYQASLAVALAAKPAVPPKSGKKPATPIKKGPATPKPPEKTAKDAARAERAKASHNPSTKAKQDISDISESQVVRALGGVKTGDNKPMDVLIGDDIGVEVKTLHDAKENRINMRSDSRKRKEEWLKEKKGRRGYIVAIDNRNKFDGGKHKDKYSGNRFYVYKGFAAVSLNRMTPVKSLSELKSHVK